MPRTFLPTSGIHLLDVDKTRDGDGDRMHEGRKRRPQRPSGAYKLLTTLLDGYVPSLIEVGEGGGSRSYLLVKSIRSLSRLLGTQSSRVNLWLAWLEDQGYITDLTWSENRRSAKLRLRRPRNI